jgi:hypothetical protein
MSTDADSGIRVIVVCGKEVAEELEDRSSCLHIFIGLNMLEK